MGDYGWVENVEAVTITWVRGLDLHEVGDLLDFDWSSGRPTTFGEAEEQQDFFADVHAVQVAELGDWLVLVEPNGYLTVETAQPLSRAGTAVSVFRNVNAVMRVVVAHRGELARDFDPLVFDTAGWQGQGERLPAELDLPFDQVDPDPWALAFELAERLTGVGIDRAWLLEGTRPTWSATGAAASQ